MALIGNFAQFLQFWCLIFIATIVLIITVIMWKPDQKTYLNGSLIGKRIRKSTTIICPTFRHYVTLISPWLQFAGFSSTSVRHKSKSSRSKNLGGKRNTVGKAYGIKRNDGCFVHKGEILVNQCGLRFYPGENVRVLTELHPPSIMKIMYTRT